MTCLREGSESRHSFGESFGQQVPGLARIPAARYAKFSVGNVPLFGRLDWNREQRLILRGGDGECESETAGQALRNVLPFGCGERAR